MSICVYFHTCNVWMDCIPLLVPDSPFYTMPPMRCMCNLVTNLRRFFTILSFNIFGNLFTVKNELTWAMICFQSDMRTRTDTRTHTHLFDYHRLNQLNVFYQEQKWLMLTMVMVCRRWWWCWYSWNLAPFDMLFFM